MRVGCAAEKIRVRSRARGTHLNFPTKVYNPRVGKQIEYEHKQAEGFLEIHYLGTGYIEQTFGAVHPPFIRKSVFSEVCIGFYQPSRERYNDCQMILQ